MPNIPKREKKRPWKVAKKSRKPQGGRRHDPDPRYHTQQWQRTRRLVIQRDPACVLCLQLGRITETSVADHVIPVRMRDGQDDHFYDIDTIRGLCKKCHARVSGRQAHGKA
jgi:5-methylcytosine-specific restriction protein A